MKTFTLNILALFCSSVCLAQATIPYTNCPDVNIAIVRAGTNSETSNPYFLYDVNPATGAMALNAGGPFKDPLAPANNLQINGIGINSTDGFIYGLVNDGSISTARFVRADKNYGVTSLGNIPSPTSPTGLYGFVNSAAGDVDRLNNYYFSASTGNPGGPTGFMLDKIFLGVISNISALAGTPAPAYYEVDYSDVNCIDFINSLHFDPTNSGLKDLVYSPFTGSFYSYLTYKPIGAVNFQGRVLEVRKVEGSSPVTYKMYCSGVSNTHTAETAGVMIDKNGSFLVLLTDGSVGRIHSSGTPYNYTGLYLPLNNATGLPSPLRGDMSSCGNVVGGPLPVSVISFDASYDNCTNTFRWVTENEINFSHYELEQSLNGVEFRSVKNIPSQRLTSRTRYTTSLPVSAKQEYYRLKLSDASGRVSYTNVISLNNSCSKISAGFNINPNPARGSLNMNWYGLTTNSIMAVSIFNAQGKLVLRTDVNVTPGGTNSIPLNGLSSGTYFMKAVRKTDGVSFDNSFIVQSR